MGRATVLIILLSGLVAPCVAIAETLTALDLKDECEGTDHGKAVEYSVFYKAMCTRYLQGMLDAYVLVTAIAQPKMKLICPPAQGISGEQARLIFLKHISEHPERLHEPARSIAFGSLSLAFPCNAEKR